MNIESASHAHKPGMAATLAIFDLDGTLTRSDTLFPFLRFLAGGRYLLRMLRVLPALAGLALGLISNQRAKEWVLRVFIAGMRREDLEERGVDFARTRMKALLRAQAPECLAWHRAQGHYCVLLTASPSIYVAPWAREAGFDEIIASELAFDAQGAATGELEGANCRGVEKVRRLEERFGDLSGYSTYGYGDTPADRHFLALCGVAHYRPFRATPSGHNRLGDLLRLMRPHQWVKNAFVFVGVLFGHAWHDSASLLAAVLAAAAFSLTASAIYIVNDLVDRNRDRLHPVKRNRPLASGKVSVQAALALAAVLVVGGATLAWAASPLVLLIAACYAGINLAYSLALKRVVILDVFIIAGGFMLRILAGTVGIGIPPSQWLLLCGFMLTLFLGFTKRRAEMLALPGDSLAHRQSLVDYSHELLDKMIGVCAAGVIMSYSLYTMSPGTIAIHGTTGLIYTVPFVIYGVFRYLHLLHRKGSGTDTSRDLARDPHMAVTVLAWLATTVWLIAH